MQPDGDDDDLVVVAAPGPGRDEGGGGQRGGCHHRQAPVGRRRSRLDPLPVPAHGGVQRCGAEQHVGREPPDIDEAAGLIRAGQQLGEVDDVGDQVHHERGHQQAEGDHPRARGEEQADQERDQQQVTERVPDRGQLLGQRQGGVAGVGGHQEGPREDGGGDRDECRVDESRSVPPRHLPPQREEQRGAEQGVQRVVGDVGHRREGRLGPVLLGQLHVDEVAEDVARHSRSQQVPRRPRLGPPQMHSHDDGQDPERADDDAHGVDQLRGHEEVVRRHSRHPDAELHHPECRHASLRCGRENHG